MSKQIPPFRMNCETDLEKWRYETWDTKEPETIEWINSFKDIYGSDDFCFFDVGANIGIYTLYCASLYPISKIVSFEPDQINFYRLVLNSATNSFKNTYVYPLAISNRSDRLEDFYIPDGKVASSGGQLDKPISEKGETFEPTDSYKVSVITVDKFSERTKVMPNFVKIDIDGQEGKVIEGMIATLKNRELKSVLIECNMQEQEKAELKALFASYEFTNDNRFNQLKDHSRNRRANNFPENIVFTRR